MFATRIVLAAALAAVIVQTAGCTGEDSVKTDPPPTASAASPEAVDKARAAGQKTGEAVQDGIDPSTARDDPDKADRSEGTGEEDETDAVRDAQVAAEEAAHRIAEAARGAALRIKDAGKDAVDAVRNREKDEE